MGMICILRNAENRQADQFCFCMAVPALALHRRIGGFLTQIGFAVFYLISVGLANRVLLRLSSRILQTR